MFRNIFLFITILLTAVAFTGCNPEGTDPSCESGSGTLHIENKATEKVIVSLRDDKGELDETTLQSGAKTTMEVPVGKYTVHASNLGGMIFLTHLVEVSCDAESTITIPLQPEIEVSLSFSGNGSGTVRVSDYEVSCNTSCTNSFPAGAQVTFTAEPADGSRFGGWNGACAAATGASCTVTADQSTTVGVTFSTAPATAPAIVSTHRIEQNWGADAWETQAIVLSDVQAGDAIIVLGIYWATTFQSVVAPVDNNGQFLAAVDQVPAHTGNNDGPPVLAQIFYELDAAAGTHVITPPDVGANYGDGTLYVVQVRGVKTMVATGQTRVTGSAIPSVAVSLSSNIKAGDFVVAIGGYDNVAQFPNAGITDPPEGWQSLGVQNDSSFNVPSEACARIAPEAGNQAVTWTWVDTGADVAVAAIAAFR